MILVASCKPRASVNSKAVRSTPEKYRRADMAKTNSVPPQNARGGLADHDPGEGDHRGTSSIAPPAKSVAGRDQSRVLRVCGQLRRSVESLLVEPYLLLQREVGSLQAKVAPEQPCQKHERANDQSRPADQSPRYPRVVVQLGR